MPARSGGGDRPGALRAATSAALTSTPPSRPAGCRWHATRTPSGKSTSGGTTSLHTAMTAGQRGWNRQPAGGSRRSGGWPGMVSRPRRSAWMLGNAPRSLAVYGWRGALKIRRTGPSSATRPAYITSVRSQVSAMTERSWVIRMSDRPSSWRSRSRSCRICAWTITSSAVVGSSPMTIAGSQARAIAIIARWRIPPDSSWGKAAARLRGIPTISSSSAARRCERSSVSPSRISIGSAIWSPTRRTGFRALIAPWNTMLTSRHR